MDTRSAISAHLLRRVIFVTSLLGSPGFLALPFLITPALAATSATASTSIIETKNGALQGQIVGNENQYLGIPFATPPMGQFRWRPPQPFGHWHGVLQATTFGNECPQLDALDNFTGDENCLFLNVYTPVSATAARGDGGLPVMVWIHGGGLTGGDASTYDPAPLVAQGVIVVTINYRLGLLGFFAQTSLDAVTRLKGNYGLMDQQLALAWVKRNIAAFGGNSNLVTIFGESAGGQSIYANLASPLAKRLFQHAIAESGSYGDYANYQEAIIPLAQAETTGSLFEQSGAAFAIAVGCADQTAKCLHAVSPQTLVAAQPFPMYPFVDGTLLPQAPSAAFASGKFNQVPVISGTNHDEYRAFVAIDYDYRGMPLTDAEYAGAVDALFGPILGPAVLAVYPLPPNPPADAASLELGASGTDGLFSCPVRTADQSLAKFVTTYTYEFNDENAPLGALPPASFPLGAYHGAELPYLFILDGVPAVFTADQQQLSNTMIGYWTQFAKTGNPNYSGAPAWTAYSASTDQFQSLIPPSPIAETSFNSEHLCSVFWTTF